LRGEAPNFSNVDMISEIFTQPKSIGSHLLPRFPQKGVTF
jgi:hypothetical protein